MKYSTKNLLYVTTAIACLSAIASAWVIRNSAWKQRDEKWRESGLTILYDDYSEPYSAVSINRQIGKTTIREHDFPPSLSSIMFRDGSVSDDTLDGLEDLVGLKTLALEGARITDKGMDIISQCPQLEILNISNTLVTDACIPRIAGIKGLSNLYIDGTATTEEGASRLRDLMPEAAVTGP